MTTAGPLRGRQFERSALERLVAGAERGEGGLALIEGSPGIGKTRILAEGAALARQQGLTAAVGAADELDQITPWGALLAALASTDPAIVRRDELMSIGGLVDMRLEVLERIRIALENAASDGPLLISIDDLHWADPLSLMAVGSLAVQLFSYPIVWLLARRPFPATPEMRALTARLASQEVVRLGLGPLEPEASAALAADVLGRAPDRHVDELVIQAHGNPMYVVELMRQSEGWTSGTGASSSERNALAARSLVTIVDRHLRSLSEAARELIKTASVLGQQFSVVELATISGRTAGELLRPVEDALAADVLVVDGDGLSFRHDLFRRAVYDDLAPPLRVALHRDAASALLALGAPVLRVATHLAIGATPGDEQAVGTLGRAVGELFATSPTSAADLALRIIDLIAPDDPRRATFVSTAVQLLGWASRLEEARRLGEAYIAEEDPPIEVEAEIRVGIHRAWSMNTSLPYPTPLPEALVVEPSVPADVRANLIAFDGLSAMLTRPASEVDETLRHALALVAGRGDGVDTAVVQAVRVTLAGEHGELLEALRIAQASLGVDADRVSRRAEGLGGMMVARALAALGRPREVLDVVVGAMSAGSSVGFTTVVAGSQSQRALALLELGRLEDACAEARSAADTAESLGLGYIFGQSLITLVEALIRQGEIVGAWAAAERIATHSPDEPTGDGWWAAALCADAEGQSATAMNAVAPMLHRLEELRFQTVVWNPSRLSQLVSIALRAGDEEAARVAARAAAELARRNPGSASIAAAAAHAQGLLNAIPALLRDAVAGLADGERPLATAAAQEDLAELLKAGDRVGAVNLLEAAYEAYVSAGGNRDAARVRAALRSLGVHKRRGDVGRPAQGWESLTKSERTVVELVARGLTNREAAGELFLSPYTINVHLRHAFTKLGIRSRVQLARLDAERERATT